MCKNLNRWQAFIIHFAFSVFVFCVVIVFIGFIWYPDVFIYTGGLQGVKIVAGVDLVLGPLLTLIVFNPIKKSLKWDLTVVGLVQVTCLAAGVWFVYGQHPLVQVLSNDGVYIFTHTDFEDDKEAKRAIDNFDGSYPKSIFLNLPSNPVHIAVAKVTQGLMEGTSFEKRIDLYRNFLDVSEESLQQRLADFEFDKDQNCYWMPLYSSQYAGTACFSTEKGIIDLKSSELN